MRPKPITAATVSDPTIPTWSKRQAGSPYAIKDYYDIDPDLAENVEDRMGEFEALVARSHDAGLDVIIDFVPNHTARCYNSDAKPAGVKDFGEDDNTDMFFSPNNNYYYMTRQLFAPSIDLGTGKSLRRISGKSDWRRLFLGIPDGQQLV